MSSFSSKNALLQKKLKGRIAEANLSSSLERNESTNNRTAALYEFNLCIPLGIVLNHQNCFLHRDALTKEQIKLLSSLCEREVFLLNIQIGHRQTSLQSMAGRP